MKRFAFVVVGAGSLAFAGQALAQEVDTDTFTASATTQEAISVVCGTDLSFGTLAVKSSGGSIATVSVPAASGGTASSNDASVYVVDAGQAAVCTVTGEDGTDATAELSDGTAIFAAPTLPAVELADTGDGLRSLGADITLSATAGIGNEDLYIGGALTVPANYAFYETYEATVTLTVTD